MFNVVVGCTWENNGRGTLALGRVFEHTQDHIRDQFSAGAAIRFDELRRYPCLFMDEGVDEQVAQIGHVVGTTVERGEVRFEYALENGIPAMRNNQIYARAGDFGMDNWEFSRTHWAVKDIDLYRAVLRTGTIERQKPRVFNIQIPEQILPRQISVMMPFDGTSAGVYEAIKAETERQGLTCNRGDDIWQHDTIIQMSSR